MNKFLNNLKEIFKEKVNILTDKIKETHNKKEPKKIKHFVVLGLMIAVAVISTYINIKTYMKSITESYTSYNYNNIISNTTKGEENVAGSNTVPSIPAINTDTNVADTPATYLTAESSITSSVAVLSNGVLEKTWPVNGKIIQEYIVDSVVYYPAVGIWKIHPGVDISAEAGEEVTSIMSGKITDIYSTDMYGYTIEITSSEYVIKYSGLTKDAVVKEGDLVKAGQKIRLYIC